MGHKMVFLSLWILLEIHSFHSKTTPHLFWVDVLVYTTDDNVTEDAWGKRESTHIFEMAFCECD